VIDFLDDHRPDDDAHCAALALFRVAALAGGIAEPVLRFAFSLSESIHAGEALLTIAVILRCIPDFAAYIPETIEFLDALLASRDNHANVIAALEAVQLMAPSCDIAFYVEKLIWNAVQLMETPSLTDALVHAVFDALSAAACYFPRVISHWAITVAEMLESAMGFIAGESEATTSMLQCMKSMLKLDDNSELKAKLITAALDQMEAVMRLESPSSAVLIEVTGMLSVLLQTMDQNLQREVIGSEGVQGLLHAALELDDRLVRQEVVHIFESAGLKGILTL
jgi:hypothetical protein